MFSFTRTKNYPLVESIIKADRASYSAMSDDNCPACEDFRLTGDDAVWYVLVREGESEGESESVLGFWALIPQSEDVAEIHTCLKSICWGAKARAAALEMSAWIWANTPFTRLTTVVPAWHRTALAFAKVSGMKESGVRKEKQMKRGELHDLICLEMHRPGV